MADPPTSPMRLPRRSLPFSAHTRSPRRADPTGMGNGGRASASSQADLVRVHCDFPRTAGVPESAAALGVAMPKLDRAGSEAVPRGIKVSQGRAEVVE